MSSQKNILMVAAENDALPGAKVGGIGDVLRDLPVALAARECRVHVILPSYGYLHQLEGSERIAHFPIEFAGRVEDVALYQIPLAATRLKDKASLGSVTEPRVTYYVIDHPALAPQGRGKVYCNDGDSRPFATDASKYAFFCIAVAYAVLHRTFDDLDIIHLHDWHAAFLAILREFDSRFTALRALRTVYTIHNLSLQGVRPFQGDPSSLKQWFPELRYDQAKICDPVHTHCVNPMRAAIVLSDRVNTVSPTYATEIQRPSDKAVGVYGGEGLEEDLKVAARSGRLFGILNGCDYSDVKITARASKAKLIETIRHSLMIWVGQSDVLASAHWLAQQRVQQWLEHKERGFLLTSVGRITDQKVHLLTLSLQYQGKTQSVLDHILERLQGEGVLVLLGSGDSAYQQFFCSVASRYQNFIYLQGYSEALAEALYVAGDCFLMPSSYEPCGISQMLAMRSGQPCLVNAVGGLNDTVIDGVSGFTFTGRNDRHQAEAFLNRLDEVLMLAFSDPKKFRTIGKAAAKERFSWEESAGAYCEQLYN